MTEYIETLITDPDRGHDLLETLAKGEPWMFLVCRIDPIDGGLDMKVETGGGISDTATVRNLLEKTLRALPS